MIRFVLAAALLALAASPALADPPPRKAPAKKADKAAEPANKKVKDIEFRVGSEVEGGRPSASDGPIVGRSPSRFAGLIRLRTSFRYEILKSAEGI